MEFKLDLVVLERGLPQGAPESPLIFVLVSELVLRPLLARWRARGSGWQVDGLWVAAVCYADDVLLLSSSLQDLQVMLAEITEAFSCVGLEVGIPKTHWTSFPPREGHCLRWSGHDLAWEHSLTFVGSVIDLSGCDARAVDYRIAQATKALGRWKPMLSCKWVSCLRRSFLVYKSIFASALWLNECLNPTQALRSRFNSWGARLLGRTYGVKSLLDDEPGDFWKRMHRKGHALCKRFGGSLSELRDRAYHRWAGHLARSPAGILHTAVRTRCLAWWRFFQHPLLPLHPRRFGRPSRWESTLENYYGVSADDDPMVRNPGWLGLAQDRLQWKTSEKEFVENVRKRL